MQSSIGKGSRAIKDYLLEMDLDRLGLAVTIFELNFYQNAL